MTPYFSRGFVIAYHKPRGICLWFTGLCNAGKSSITPELLSHQKIARWAVLLDGDHLCNRLWEELGSPPESAAPLAASHVVRVGRVAICVIISPYSEGRRRVNVE